MVEVATALEVPVKFVMPNLVSTVRSCSMLGLGDIVIPGVYILYMKAASEQIPQLNGSKIYFWSCMIAYAISLLSCGIVLLVFNAAQPALLYIVPALLTTTYSLAIYRGELDLLNTGISRVKDEDNKDKQDKKDNKD